MNVSALLYGTCSWSWTLTKFPHVCAVYGDIVVLPIKENMNDGKTYAYFSWAYENALVPPPRQNSTHNSTALDSPQKTVRHDPLSHAFSDWVKPDYVIKTDDDSFVMLAELEARLRVELHVARAESAGWDPLVYWGCEYASLPCPYA
jgi:hypothetical protein